MDQSKSLIKGKLEKLRREAEERDAQRRANKTGFPYADLITAPINMDALDLIDEEFAKKAKIAAFEIKEKKVALAVFNPDNAQAKEIIEKLKNERYEPSIFVVSLSGLNHVLSFYRFVPEKTKEITGSVEIKEKSFLELKDVLISLGAIKNELLAPDAAGAATQTLEIILAGALANRASDIHLEPSERGVKLRLRIDGLLHDVFEKLDRNVYERLLSRIKLLSRLKLNISDEPQDGRFSINLPDKAIEIRTSVIPSEFGETAVLRILDPETIRLNLSDLGFRDDDLEIIKKELSRPNGMILNTGPTGSGKTTTLYTFLRQTQRPEIKIITIEDPIEYHLEGIEQTQVDPEAGYTFSGGLRSILRQDPDMILVGEIRDLETAEIAMHSALTGHLVFSTLHTNEASGAVPRLIDMGVKPSVIAPAINLIIAQRLVRRLCQNCRQEQEINSDLKNKINKFLEKLPVRANPVRNKTQTQASVISNGVNKNFQEIKIFNPRIGGCEKCNNIGYKGRVGIFELFLMSPDLEKLIAKEPVEAEIKELAFKQGMVSMQGDGILKALQGITTLEEVERITGPLEW
jgi:type IV pilus assembly protein PilB